MFESKSKIRRERESLRAECRRLNARLKEVIGDSKTLTANQQALVDAYWNQKVLASSAFFIRGMLLILLVIIAIAAASVWTWQAEGLTVRLGALCILGAIFLYLLYKTVRGGMRYFDDIPKGVALPSGEVVAVTPEQYAKTDHTIKQMMRS